MKRYASILGLATVASLAVGTPATAAPTPTTTPTGSPSARPGVAGGSSGSTPSVSASAPSATSSATPHVATAAAADQVFAAAVQRANLGTPLGPAAAFGAGLRQAFSGGIAYWSAATGAHVLTGPVATKYEADGPLAAALGLPVADVYQIAGGQVANFVHGQIAYTPTTGAHATVDGIGTWYAQLGSVTSPLGFPTTDETAGLAPGSAVNRFQNGTIVWTATTGSHEVYSGIGALYAALGYEGGYLGVPTSGEQDGRVPGSRENLFANGVVLWSPATGSNAVANGNYARYESLGGEAGTLGLPTTSEADGMAPGSRVNRFQNGTIVWTANTGSRSVVNGNAALYSSLGYEGGPLGVPSSDEFDGAHGSRVNSFTGGRIVWSSGTGSHEVHGGNGALYDQLGDEGGDLGLPTTDEHQGYGDTRVNLFTNGCIVWSPATGSHSVIGNFYDEYKRREGTFGTLGSPTSERYAIDGGYEQQFQGGKLTYRNGSFQSDALQSSTTDVGNAYALGNCTWYVYEKRKELGAPVGSYWGNGGQWADSARREGFRVDHTPQVGAAVSTYNFGANPYYGHVMIVERINDDGSFTVSQMNVPSLWVVSERTFSADDAQGLWFIH